MLRMEREKGGGTEHGAPINCGQVRVRLACHMAKGLPRWPIEV
jgi:hypothetical protein